MAKRECTLTGKIMVSGQEEELAAGAVGEVVLDIEKHANNIPGVRLHLWTHEPPTDHVQFANEVWGLLVDENGCWRDSVNGADLVMELTELVNKHFGPITD